MVCHQLVQKPLEGGVDYCKRKVTQMADNLQEISRVRRPTSSAQNSITAERPAWDIRTLSLAHLRSVPYPWCWGSNNRGVKLTNMLAVTSVVPFEQVQQQKVRQLMTVESVLEQKMQEAAQQQQQAAAKGGGTAAAGAE